MLNKVRAIVIGVILAVVSSISLQVFADENQEPDITKSVQAVGEAFEIIKSYHTKQVAEEDLLHSAIRGMLKNADRHSVFFEKEDLSSLEKTTHGKYVGIGIETIGVNGDLTIVSPLPNSPAKRLGMKSGDVIIKVRKQLVEKIGIPKALDTMKGRLGEKIKLTVLREDKEIKFEIPFENISLVASEFKVDDDIGVIRVFQFQEGVADTVIGYLEKLESLNITNLIIDLRSNPGGVVFEAIQMADAFINKGLLARLEGRSQNEDQVFVADPKVMFDGNIVVLVNSGSASASELLTAILRDKKIAKVAGSKTFGKASVQKIYYLSDGSGMKLTTSHYYPPSNVAIDGKGLMPEYDLSMYEEITASDGVLDAAMKLF